MRGLVSDADLGFGDRAIPAAGAAVLVNLLDVAETSLLAHAPGVPYNLSQQHAVSRGSNSLYSKEKRKKKNHYLIGTFGCYSIVQPGWNPCFRVILSSWLFLVQSNTRCIQQGRRQVGIYLPCYDVLCNWLKG
ncbi:mitochondrial carrier protein MTM1-like isoform X7 [Elaeis guineensis]|uniref:mitochondrial carrier protein MTM1-like isoform X7 n=1 Tax=Elaeis guineensis var. tenera TaxID=51953 RepID=UPI003C6CD410